MGGIFISHASADKRQAELIAARLKSLGFVAFFSPRDIKEASKWEETLADQMDRAQMVLVYATKEWIGRAWCRAEFYAARLARKTVFVVDATRGGLSQEPLLSSIHLTQYDVKRKGDLDKLVRSIREVASPETRFIVDPSRSPYPGLAALDVEDACVFFGRDRETEDILIALNEVRGKRTSARFTILFGPSGSGKSSVLRAGVVARARQDPALWHVLPPVVPGIDPLDQINSLKESVDRALAELRTPGQTKPKASRQQPAVLVPIDQFEEVFRQPPKVIEEISACLRKMLEEPWVQVVATLRSDFMPALQENTDALGPWNGLPINKFDIRNLRDIVLRPARQHRLDVDEELIDAIQADAHTGDALPLVAFALERAWKRVRARNGSRLTLADYEPLGPRSEKQNRLECILIERAQEALSAAGFTPDIETELRQAFIPALVDVRPDGDPVRRRASAKELTATACQLLEHLAGWEWRLINIDSANGQRVFEVAHEALLRRWPLLSDAVSEEAAALGLLQAIERENAEWVEAGAGPDFLLRLSGQRLADAEALAAVPSYGARAQSVVPYIRACRKLIDAKQQREVQLESDRVAQLDLRVQREILIALEKGRHSAALRYTTDGSLQGMSLPRAETAVARALHESRFHRHSTICSGPISAAGYCAATGVCVVGSTDGVTVCVDIESKKVFWSRSFHAWPLAIDFDRDGKRVALGFEDGVVAILDAETGALLAERRAHRMAVFDLRFSPNAELIATASQDGTADVLLSANLDPIGRVEAHVDTATACVFSLDGKRLYTTSWDQRVRIVELENGLRTRFLPVSQHVVRGALLAPNGEGLSLFCSDGGVVALGKDDEVAWRVDSGELSALVAFDYSPCGNHVLCAFESGIVQTWEIGAERPNSSTRLGDELIVAGFFVGRRERFVLVSERGQIAFFEFDRITYRTELEVEVTSAILDPERNRLLVFDVLGRVTAVDLDRSVVQRRRIAANRKAAVGVTPQQLFDMAVEAVRGTVSAPTPATAANILGSQWPWLRRVGPGQFVEARNLTLAWGDVDRLEARLVQLHPRMIGALDVAIRGDRVEILTAAGMVISLDIDTLATERMTQLEVKLSLAKLLKGVVLGILPGHGLVECDTESGGLKRALDIDGATPVSSSSSADGSFALVTARGGRLFRVEPDGPVAEIPELGALSTPPFIDSRGVQAAVGLYGGRLAIFQTGHQSSAWRPKTLALSGGKYFQHMSWSPTGNALLCVYRDGDAVLIRRGKRSWVVVELDFAGEHFRFVDWNDDGSELRLMSNRSLRTYATVDGRTLSMHPTPYDCLGACFPEPNRLAFWLTNARLKDAENGSPVTSWTVRTKADVGGDVRASPTEVEKKIISKAKFNQTGDRVTARQAGSVDIEVHKGDYDAFEPSPSGQRFWLSLPDKTIVVGTIVGDSVAKTLERSRERVAGHEFSDDERFLCLRYEDGAVELIDLDSQTPMATIAAFCSERDKVGFAPAMSALISVSADGQIVSFDFHALCLRGDELANTISNVLAWPAEQGESLQATAVPV